jgi:hypothetical protein
VRGDPIAVVIVDALLVALAIEASVRVGKVPSEHIFTTARSLDPGHTPTLTSLVVRCEGQASDGQTPL